MTSLGSAILELYTDSSVFNQGLDTAEKRVKAFGDRLTGLGKVFTVGVSAPLGLIGAGAVLQARG